MPLLHDASNCQPRRVKRVKRVKYKTEQCKNYSEKGYCPYLRKCQFAHGKVEAVDAPIRKFRTKKCKSYWELGVCTYGRRCHFEHEAEVSAETKDYLRIWGFVLGRGSAEEESQFLAVGQVEAEGT